jgi:hypothetical protein
METNTSHEDYHCSEPFAYKSQQTFITIRKIEVLLRSDSAILRDLHTQSCISFNAEGAAGDSIMRRIVQIAATTNKLFALCDDDTLHLYDFTELGWVLLPPVPNGHAALMERLEDRTSLLADDDVEEENDNCQ